jgi:hypothetical protein
MRDREVCSRGGARLGAFPLLVLVLLAGALAGCDGDDVFGVAPRNPAGNFTLTAKYSYVRSYPDGGGVFILSLTPGAGFTGTVDLAVEADPVLNAQLSRPVLDARRRIAELTIRPAAGVEHRMYAVEVVASQGAAVQSVPLQVEVFSWGSGSLPEMLPRRDAMIAWLESAHPELGPISGADWYPYMTYPEILIVEHWTFLSPEWELRMAYHVMMPPDDWTLVEIRRRGELDFRLAAKREGDGTTYEIPLSDYPTFFGY